MIITVNLTSPTGYKKRRLSGNFLCAWGWRREPRMPILLFKRDASSGQPVPARIDGDIFAGERCHFMGDINHWTGLEKALFFYGRPLCHKHVIRILRLAEYVHDTSVEGIGMIAALMIERVPEAASYMLPRSAVKSIIAGVFVGWTGIVLCLYKHGLLSPVACYATGRIVRVPVIHIVTPFTCEVSLTACGNRRL